nr:hypothetical protein [Bacteroidota bacterium]
MKKSQFIVFIVSAIVFTTFVTLQTNGQKLTKPNETGPTFGQHSPMSQPSFIILPFNPDKVDEFGQPVNCNTFNGNLWTERSDLYIPGRGLSMGAFFSYNSLLSEEDHGFGNGWNANFLIRARPFDAKREHGDFVYGINSRYNPVATAGLIFGEETITIPRSDGQKDVFTWNGSGYDPPVGVYDQLEEYEPGTWKLTSVHGIVTWFEDAFHHKVTRVFDRNGNTITFSYIDGKLSIVTDPTGRQLLLTWAGEHLTQITDPNPEIPRTVQYQYDENGNMTHVTDPMGNVTQYGYDENGNMTGITDPLSNQLEFAYDEEMAIAEISCAEVGYSKSFIYNIEDRSTTVNQSISTGNQETTYFFDDSEGVVQIQYSDGNSVFFEWDEFNNLISYIDENGNTTYFSYDDCGNILSVTDCNGNTETFIYKPMPNEILFYTDKTGNTTSYAYDDLGNLLTETDCIGNVSSYTYDEFGNQVTFTDKEGNTTSYTYDDNGNLITITDALGNTSTYSYDPVGNLIGKTDRNLCITAYEYDPLNRLVTLTDALGYQENYDYDANGNLVDKTNKKDCLTSYEYDPLNRLIKTIKSNGGEYTTTYDEAGNPVSETDVLGHTTTYSYDTRNWLISLTDCAGYSESFDYDPAGNMTSSTSKNGNITSYEYDCLNRLISLTDPLGETETYNYDAVGRQIAFTDMNGNTQSNEFDCLGRLISSTDPLGYSKYYEYDAIGNQYEQTNKNGHTSTFGYDALGRLLSSTDPSGYSEYYEYDPEGNSIGFTDKNGSVTTWEYDCLGRQISTTDPDDFVESYGYDPVGNRTGFTNKNGGYDSINYDCDCARIVLSIDAAGNIETFEYDLACNMIGSTDKNGQTTNYSYDCMNRLTIAIDPLGNQEIHTYDPEGHETGFTDKNGNTTTYIYDCCWLIGVSDPMGFTIDYSYDPVGNRISETDKNGNITGYSYDDLNRLVDKTKVLGYVFTYSYDPEGNLITETDANGNVSTYSYDPLNRLVDITDVLGYVSNYSFDPVGNRISETDANGNVSTYSYDPLNRLVDITDALGYVSNYSYDPVGNRISETDANGNISTYSYDPLNRLIQDTDALGNISTYSYDPVGNRISQTDPDGNTTHCDYDAMNRLILAISPSGLQSLFVYDGVGNRVSQTDPNGSTVTCTFDILNRMTQRSYPDGTGVNYTYDNAGNLTGTVNTSGIGETVAFIYDALNRLVNKETDYGDFTKTIGYSYDPVGNRIDLTSDAGTITYSYDALNRIIEVTDQESRITGFEYDPLGNQTAVYYPNGIVTTSEYDELSRVIQVVTSPDSKELKFTGESVLSYDCGIAEIISPVTGSGLTASEPVQVVVMNYGTEPAEGVGVYYSINGGDPVFESLNQPVPVGGGPLIFLFEQTADLSVPGMVYEITACTMMELDENPENDCQTSIVIHENGGGVAFDCGISNIFSPVSGHGLTDAETVTVEVFNYGTQPASGVAVSYSISGADPVIELLEETVFPGVPMDYIFTQTADLSTPGLYELTACTFFELDEDPENDCFSLDVIHEEGGGIYQSFNYEYDPVGNKILEVHEDASMITYSYDACSRLIEESYLPSGVVTAYTYTPAGRRASKTENGVSENYSYDPDGNLMSAGNLMFNNDNNGNRTSKVDGDLISNYGYNSENQLTNVVLPTGNEIEYHYSTSVDVDGDGILDSYELAYHTLSFYRQGDFPHDSHFSRQIAKEVNGNLTFFQSDGLDMLEEYDDLGVLNTSYCPDISIDMGDETGFYHFGTEHRLCRLQLTNYSSTTMQSNLDQEEVASASFDAFGIPDLGGTWMNDQFSFKSNDWDSEVDYYGSGSGQFYDQTTGALLNPSANSQGDGFGTGTGSLDRWQGRDWWHEYQVWGRHDWEHEYQVWGGRDWWREYQVLAGTDWWQQYHVWPVSYPGNPSGENSSGLNFRMLTAISSNNSLEGVIIANTAVGVSAFDQFRDWHYTVSYPIVSGNSISILAQTNPLIDVRHPNTSLNFQRNVEHMGDGGRIVSSEEGNKITLENIFGKNSRIIITDNSKIGGLDKIMDLKLDWEADLGKSGGMSRKNKKDFVAVMDRVLRIFVEAYFLKLALGAGFDKSERKDFIFNIRYENRNGKAYLIISASCRYD